MVNEPSVFEPLKFYRICISNTSNYIYIEISVFETQISALKNRFKPIRDAIEEEPD